MNICTEKVMICIQKLPF